MNKLKLRFDNLRVESFETSEAAGERRGTVLGASVIEPRPVSLGCDFVTRFTGGCCEYTFAYSCNRETLCDCL
jgi:hypothetical protein